MFTLVTGIVGRWRAVCVTALQRPNSDAAAIRIVVGAQLQVITSNAPITSEPGTTAVLQCMFSSGLTPVDPAQVRVFWKHDGKKVLSYVDTITAFRPGAHISEEQLAKGDASLSLPVVTQDDAGLYSCSILLGSEEVTNAVNLIVSDGHCGIVVCFDLVVRSTRNDLASEKFPKVQPEVFFYFSNNGEENSSLVCLVSGFYPDDLNLSMKKVGELLDCKINKWRNSNGTYSLEAMYETNVTYTDSDADYTCSVHHSTIREGTTERLKFLLVDYIPVPLRITIICGILLLVGINIFCKQGNEISVSKDWTEGSIVTLECSITGRHSKNISAVWLVRQGDKEIKIYGNMWMDPVDDYKEMQEQDSYTCVNILTRLFSYSLRSILSFQVHKQRHHQAEFICRFMKAGKVLQEKKYFGIVPDSDGSCSVSDICVPETCKEGEKLTLCCTMTGSIPQDISIKWEKDLKKERTLISKELDANYQVTENKTPGQICAFLTLCPTYEDSGAVFTVSFSKNKGQILIQRSSMPLKVAVKTPSASDSKSIPNIFEPPPYFARDSFSDQYVTVRVPSHTAISIATTVRFVTFQRYRYDIAVSDTQQRSGILLRIGKHRVTKRGPALSNPMFTLVTRGLRHRWSLESCLCDSSPATTLRFTYDHGQVISLVVIVGKSYSVTVPLL
ncbi:unnamed protein product [Ranitomeya imitator]|uniref:Ig-like domain-containing protein n=1 Tax=Ranitomeya imitator TaxID=111125 RepID=A0ABN9L678_9NEOB|nr:unnamed protein product [Ranitomeya imitator]